MVWAGWELRGCNVYFQTRFEVWSVRLVVVYCRITVGTPKRRVVYTHTHALSSETAPPNHHHTAPASNNNKPRITARRAYTSLAKRHYHHNHTIVSYSLIIRGDDGLRCHHHQYHISQPTTQPLQNHSLIQHHPPQQSHGLPVNTM